MVNVQTSLEDAADVLAAAYIHCSADTSGEMQRRCVGIIGAGEALSTIMIRGQCSGQAAAVTEVV